MGWIARLSRLPRATTRCVLSLVCPTPKCVCSTHKKVCLTPHLVWPTPHMVCLTPCMVCPTPHEVPSVLFLTNFRARLPARVSIGCMGWIARLSRLQRATTGCDHTVCHPGDNIRANGTSQKWTRPEMPPDSGGIMRVCLLLGGVICPNVVSRVE